MTGAVTAPGVVAGVVTAAAVLFLRVRWEMEVLLLFWCTQVCGGMAQQRHKKQGGGSSNSSNGNMQPDTSQQQLSNVMVQISVLLRTEWHAAVTQTQLSSLRS